VLTMAFASDTHSLNNAVARESKQLSQKHATV
jgi:hypothetical protein